MSLTSFARFNSAVSLSEVTHSWPAGSITTACRDQLSSRRHNRSRRREMRHDQPPKDPVGMHAMPVQPASAVVSTLIEAAAPLVM